MLRGCGEETTGPFRLANRDFGAHNVLVNGDFDIVGLIDFDGVMAGPLEAVAQYPIFCGLEVEPPGVVPSEPMMMESAAQALPRLEAYKEMLRKYEEEDASDNTKVADRLGSMSASVFQGMMHYQSQVGFTNDRWMASCLKMLQEQSMGNRE